MKKSKKILKRVLTFALVVVCLLCMSVVAFADGGNFGSSTLANGIKNIVSDVTAWLTGIALAVGTLVIVFFLIRRAMADEQDKKQYNSRIITALVSTIGVVVASSLISIITGYFQ